MDVKEIREALAEICRLEQETCYSTMDDKQDHVRFMGNMGRIGILARQSYTALSAIDPEAIKRTVLLDAIKSISILNQMSVESSINDDYLIGYGFGVRDCQIKLESILQSEPGPR